LTVALGVGGVALVVPLLLAGHAGAAEPDSPPFPGESCTATINGASIAAYSSPSRALRVGRNDVVNVAGVVNRRGEPDDIVQHTVRLEIAGVRWTVDEGVDDGTRWYGKASIKKYATHGEGLYKVVVTAVSTNGAICYGTAYVRVGDSNPINSTAGAAAAGATLVGVGAAAAAGGKQFTNVVDEMDTFDRKLADADAADRARTDPTDAAAASRDSGEEATARYRMFEDLQRLRERKAFEKRVLACSTVVVAGVGLTVLAMAQDAARTVVALIGRLPR
jgi:hypothetical protein